MQQSRVEKHLDLNFSEITQSPSLLTQTTQEKFKGDQQVSFVGDVHEIKLFHQRRVCCVRSKGEYGTDVVGFEAGTVQHDIVVGQSDLE